MKIAIVHDELMRRGGAEQVVRCFHQAFPKAPIYTMAYRQDLTYPDFKECTIKTSWFNKICFSESILKKLFFPFGLWAMKQMKISGFDVVLISSTYAAKYPKVAPNTIVINYCHTPFRLAWYPESYRQYTNSKGVIRYAFNIVKKILQKIDFSSAQRTDHFIANTKEVTQRIKDVYNYQLPVEVINPPVNCNNFYVTKNTKNYYLVVCRLESYKKIDLIIEAFNALGYPLIIVGKGSLEDEFKKMAKSNITFKSGLSTKELAKLYAECKAFVFAQKEDYGITPLEANASGRPVIAYGEGGVKETMIPYKDDASKATALFFETQTPDNLIEAIKKFESLNFSPEFIRKHAEGFDEEMFIANIREYVESIYKAKEGEFSIDEEAEKTPLNVKIA